MASQLDIPSIITSGHSAIKAQEDNPIIVSKLMDIMILLEWFNIHLKDVEKLFNDFPFEAQQFSKSVSETRKPLGELATIAASELDKELYSNRLDALLKGDFKENNFGLIQCKVCVIHANYNMLYDWAKERGVTPGYILFEEELTRKNPLTQEEIAEKWECLPLDLKSKYEHIADDLVMKERKEGGQLEAKKELKLEEKQVKQTGDEALKGKVKMAAPVVQ